MEDIRFKFCKWFLFLLFLLPKNGLSQEIRFDKLTVANGLSNNSVRSIFKDYLGFMWIGTLDGLDRYDGIEIRSYTEKFPGDQQQVNCIINDERNGFWVGTDGGLFYWDYISPEFRQISISENEINVTTLVSLPDDSLMLAASSQNIFLINTESFKYLKIELNGPNGEDIGGITDGLYDGGNIVWLFTARSLIKLNLMEYSFQIFKNNTQDSTISNFSCFTLYEGNILVGTYLDGIFLFEVEEERFYPFKGVKNNFILSLDYQPEKKRLHVGTDGNGLIVYNTQTQNLRSFEKDNSNRYSLNSNAIYSIFIDDDYRYWLGTYQGGVNYNHGEVDLFDVSTEKNGIFLGNKSIRSIFFDGNGNEFVGTKDGLFVFRKDGTNQYFNTDNNDVLNSNVILALKKNEENLLVGTFHGGLNLYDMQSKELKSFSTDPNYQRKSFYAIDHDQDGNLWLGSMAGLYRIDKKTHKIRHFTRNNSQLKRDGLISLFLDSQNRIWIGSVVGTSVYSIDSEQLINIETDFNLFSYKTVCFFEDHRKNIWLATEGDGLCEVDPDLSEINCYKTDDGLSSNFITAITEAPDDIFWVSSSKGLSRFDRIGENFSNYTLSDGLPSLVFNRGAVFNDYDSTGKIWFGSEGGMFSFNPDSLMMRRSMTKVVLTDFYLSGQVVEPKLGTFLDSPVDLMTEIHLPRGDNNFGFRFVSLNYQNPIENKYYYRMLGIDENWQVAEGNHVNFSDIKPGKYTFEICLSESVPSDDNIISSIDIIVEPRLYQNRFFLVFLVVFLSGIFFFGLYFIKRLNRRLAKLKESQFGKISRPKYETSYLSYERRKEIEEALLKYISESKVYENPELKISDLATALDCSPHHISQVINQNLNQSFYEFINSYRIESVKFYMEDPSSQRYTLYAIAQKCGYKSKTSFYRAFKKITGHTPTEYQAMLNEKH